MKKYTNPEVSFDQLLAEDILTLSVGDGDGDSGAFNDLFVQG